MNSGYLHSALAGACFLIGGALIGGAMLLMPPIEQAHAKPAVDNPDRAVSETSALHDAGVMLVTSIKG